MLNLRTPTVLFLSFNKPHLLLLKVNLSTSFSGPLSQAHRTQSHIQHTASSGTREMRAFLVLEERTSYSIFKLNVNMNITGHMEVCWTAFHMSFVVYLSTRLPEGPRPPVSAVLSVLFFILH